MHARGRGSRVTGGLLDKGGLQWAPPFPCTLLPKPHYPGFRQHRLPRKWEYKLEPARRKTGKKHLRSAVILILQVVIFFLQVFNLKGNVVKEVMNILPHGFLVGEGMESGQKL